MSSVFRYITLRHFFHQEDLENVFEQREICGALDQPINNQFFLNHSQQVKVSVVMRMRMWSTGSCKTAL